MKLFSIIVKFDIVFRTSTVSQFDNTTTCNKLNCSLQIYRHLISSTQCSFKLKLVFLFRKNSPYSMHRVLHENCKVLTKSIVFPCSSNQLVVDIGDLRMTMSIVILKCFAIGPSNNHLTHYLDSK